MRPSLLGLWLVIGLGLAGSAGSQPPQGKKGDSGKMPIHVIPPFAVDELQLTPAQERQIQELERDLRTKVMRILTPEQLRKLRDVRPPHERGGAMGDDKKGGKGGPMGDEKKGGKGGPPMQVDAPPAKTAPIAWFARWQDAVEESKRTERPILLVSAAPHCSGVSGVW